jgi:hypothetical protein
MSASAASSRHFMGRVSANFAGSLLLGLALIPMATVALGLKGCSFYMLAVKPSLSQTISDRATGRFY